MESLELMAHANTVSGPSSRKTYYDTLRPFQQTAPENRPNAATPHWICGTVDTPLGTLPQVSTAWTKEDSWGQIKARTSSFRMNYRVEPGLYAVGTPDESSDVLLSANYKLSFDMLRRELDGMDVWILVLDTDGINVWCAAGKGTFSSEEVVRRIQKSQLAEVVTHRTVIAPQLAAPGVNATEVTRQSGFKVLFGPVRAADIPAYLQNGYAASREMRKVKFSWKDRLVLTPIEMLPLLKKFPVYALLVLLLFGLQPSGFQFRSAWIHGAPFLLLGFITLLTGSVVTPALLPILPFRSFGVKGWFAGLLAILLSLQFVAIDSVLLQILSCLIFPLAVSYLALQFTGSTTFTGISAVKRELRVGMPIYKIGAAASIGLFALYTLQRWRVL